MSKPRTRRTDRRGFTLAETILVLIVGSVLIGAATVLYQSARASAGDAAANQKVIQLQTIIEKLIAANNGQTPSAASLADAWSGARPNDFGSNPWGGLANCTGASCVNLSNNTPSGLRVLTTQAGRCFRQSNLTTQSSGVLVYFQYVRPGNSVEAEQHIDVFDQTIKAHYHASQYAVAAESSSGRQFYFVHGPPNFVGGIAQQPDGTCASAAGLSGTVGIPSSLDP